MALAQHELKALAIELAAAMPPMPQAARISDAAAFSGSIDGIADILTGMVGEEPAMDGRLYACADLLRRISLDLDKLV